MMTGNEMAVPDAKAMKNTNVTDVFIQESARP